MKCIHGEGPREQVETLIEKTLSEQGKSYRVKEYNRIKIYKMSLFKKIILIYNYSDSTFQICGDKKILDNIRKNVFIYTSKVKILDYMIRAEEKLTSPDKDEIVKLLMKRQIIIDKLWACRIKNRLTPLLLILVFITFYSRINDISTIIAATIVIGIILLLAPITTRIDGKPVYLTIFTCHKLKREKKLIDQQLIKLMKNVKNENLKKIIALQFRKTIE